MCSGPLATDHSSPKGDRAPKRLRLSTDAEDDAPSNTFRAGLCRQLTKALTGRSTSDLDGLSQISAAGFKRLTEDEQCRALDILGTTACKFACNEATNTCRICDEAETHSRRDEVLSTSFEDELLNTLIVLLQNISRHSKSRVVAMVALRRLIMHTRSAALLKLKSESRREVIDRHRENSDWSCGRSRHNRAQKH